MKLCDTDQDFSQIQYSFVTVRDHSKKNEENIKQTLPSWYSTASSIISKITRKIKSGVTKRFFYCYKALGKTLNVKYKFLITNIVILV